MTELVGRGPCAVCGHNPACGYASIQRGAEPERWYCHTDDHSCYGRPETWRSDS